MMFLAAWALLIVGFIAGLSFRGACEDWRACEDLREQYEAARKEYE